MDGESISNTKSEMLSWSMSYKFLPLKFFGVYDFKEEISGVEKFGDDSEGERNLDDEIKVLATLNERKIIEFLIS